MPGRGQRPGKKGGQQTGPNPTDRGKSGTKRHVVVDRRGTPLAALPTGGDRHDRVPFEDLLDAVPPIKRPSGQRRKRPAKPRAGEAYDCPRCRRAPSRRRIKARIARKGVDPSERLGRRRWVVERTMAWFDQFRRRTIRYERRPDIHAAFLSLGCSLICANAIQRYC